MDGYSRPWVSGTVAAIARELVRLVAEATGPDDQQALAHLVRPIAEVGAMAQPQPGAADPDPSSWPTAFGSFVGLGLRAIAELSARERGSGAVPLLDTDELYEA